MEHDQNMVVKLNINLGDSFLVNVTAVSGPGKFYVLPVKDVEQLNRLCVDPLQKAASISPLPVKILSNRKYAVLDSDRKWSRAIIGRPSGKFQVFKSTFTIHFYIFN